MVETIIEVKNLTKKFNSLIAVNRVNFSVFRGEIFGFLGPNGAGKTTTIRMLTGVLTPDIGEIFIDGINIRKNPISAKMKMGIVPEIGNIYVDLTAKKNIILSGKFYGLSTRELSRKADALLENFELYKRKDDRVRTFSKGMKQRVSIASAIIHNPPILFLDEPTSGLDVKSQRLIRNIIKNVNILGTTVFLTTHNIEEASNLCDRVGIIDKGKIAVIDKPEVLRGTIKKTKSVEVSFDKIINTDLLKNTGLIYRVEKLGDKLKLYTDNPDRVVKYLVKLAQDDNLTIISLEILKASLEDAYIRFTERG